MIARVLRLAAVIGLGVALTGCNMLYGWGQGRSGTPSSSSPIDVGSGRTWGSVDAGVTRSCAITLGKRLLCGSPSGEQEMTVVEEPEPDWVAVTVGQEHVCGLRGSGSLYCWGSNGSGQLGIGSGVEYTSTPQRVSQASDWRAVSASEQGTCAIRGAGDLYCWGGGALVGTLVGDGTLQGRTEPTRIGTGSDWIAVDIHRAHGCGIRSPGTLHCWAYLGGAGDGTTAQRLSPIRIGTASDWTAVSVGSFHSCGLRSGGLYCWGDNAYGQLGDGTHTIHLAPTRVGPDSDWTDVSVGTSDLSGGSGGGGEYIAADTCAIRKPGALYCWGANAFGELGDGTTTERVVPTRIGAEVDWLSVSAGGGYTRGIRSGS